ncbi:hypothetical protein BDV95DRAFT_590326 [Massariosphaeria phaeospora]|uniref:Uncharacterized protein n=1 Tax=Massariosphaeria phaeospora TaxID=100035 RepID=A0A7C8IFU7_9PLEO|nr:hypothetical protein BDV95DRAFT_590326 [Massariosphaeria phaeospora]
MDGNVDHPVESLGMKRGFNLSTDSVASYDFIPSPHNKIASINGPPKWHEDYVEPEVDSHAVPEVDSVPEVEPHANPEVGSHTIPDSPPILTWQEMQLQSRGGSQMASAHPPTQQYPGHWYPPGYGQHPGAIYPSPHLPPPEAYSSMHHPFWTGGNGWPGYNGTGQGFYGMYGNQRMFNHGAYQNPSDAQWQYSPASVNNPANPQAGLSNEIMQNTLAQNTAVGQPQAYDGSIANVQFPAAHAPEQQQDAAPKSPTIARESHFKAAATDTPRPNKSQSAVSTPPSHAPSGPGRMTIERVVKRLLNPPKPAIEGQTFAEINRGFVIQCMGSTVAEHLEFNHGTSRVRLRQDSELRLRGRELGLPKKYMEWLNGDSYHPTLKIDDHYLYPKEEGSPSASG